MNALNPSWYKINPDTGCWEWQRARTRNGYGVVRFNGKPCYAHRLSYELSNGSFDLGLDVCHACDHPSCVNPAHLFLGNASDNAKDMVRKGRKGGGFGDVSGVHNVNAKLNPEIVIQIRQMAVNGASQRAIAKHFSVAQATVGSVIRGETWGHVSHPV